MAFHGHLEHDPQPLSVRYPILFSSEHLPLFEIIALFAYWLICLHVYMFIAYLILPGYKLPVRQEFHLCVFILMSPVPGTIQVFDRCFLNE